MRIPGIDHTGAPPCTLALVFALSASANAQDKTFGDFFERDFPWHGSTVEAGVSAASRSPFPSRNRTPRGLILRAGSRGYACFDTELLRIAAVWIGEKNAAGGVSEVGMAAGSYHRGQEAKKAPQGQELLPRVRGTLLAATGMYAGWQVPKLQLEDPRPKTADASEMGLGPLPLDRGRFSRIELAGDRATVIYDVAGTELRESWSSTADPLNLVRELQIAPHDHDIVHVLADLRRGKTPVELSSQNAASYSIGEDTVSISLSASIVGSGRLTTANGTLVLRIPAHKRAVTLRLIYRLGRGALIAPVVAKPSKPASDLKAQPRRWPNSVKVSSTLASASAGYAIDRIPMPLPNPWNRNVRAAGIAFLPDDGEGKHPGRAVVVTFDGDLWMLSNIGETLDRLRWSRFAAGLHEPQSVVVWKGDILVFTRTGVMRIVDTDGDGEADRYENYCNRFAQSAETREFALDMELAPDGSLLIAKGGQQRAHITMLGGSILRVPPGGRRYEVIARGLREPFVGVHPASGAITASDQQGHWVPTTVVQRVATGDTFGFRDPGRLLLDGQRKDRAPEPSRAPWTWIPHEVCKSAAGQVWAPGSQQVRRFGPLSGHMLQVAYYDPGVILVYGSPSEDTTIGGAVRLPWQFWFPPLDGRVRTADHSLWLTGFRIWGSESIVVSGLARVRPTGEEMPLPVDIAAHTEGIVLRFGQTLDRDAARNAGNYVVQSFAYRRSHRYGSGHFRRNGKPGHDALLVDGVQLGRDGRSVLLRVGKLRPVMQMSVRFVIAAAGGEKLHGEVFATLPKLEPIGGRLTKFHGEVHRAEGGTPTGRVAARASIKNGAALFAGMGCVACHSTDGTTQGRVGPTMKALFGRMRELSPTAKKKGKKQRLPKTVRADEAYLRRSIIQPADELLKGYAAVMPSYAGVLRDEQIESLLLFLRSLE